MAIQIVQRSGCLYRFKFSGLFQPENDPADHLFPLLVTVPQLLKKKKIAGINGKNSPSFDATAVKAAIFGSCQDPTSR